MNGESTVTVRAPAKVNLGLEVLGKRPDGFHEIRSVLAMLDLYDTVTVGAEQPDGRQDYPAVSDDDNLVQRALDAYRCAVPGSPVLWWNLEKRIPIAAGLGGASSDAAAALMAANALSPSPLTGAELASIAAMLGSDVPFFLGGPWALATGRGTDLESCPTAGLDMLLLVPREEISEKTPTLYGLLRRSDFSNDGNAMQVIEALRQQHLPGIASLRNTFSRPLCELLPRVRLLQEQLRREVDLIWGLSGAGPAHYIFASTCEHPAIIKWLQAQFGEWLDVQPARTIVESPCGMREHEELSR